MCWQHLAAQDCQDADRGQGLVGQQAAGRTSFCADFWPIGYVLVSDERERSILGGGERNLKEAGAVGFTDLVLLNQLLTDRQPLVRMALT